MMDPLSAIRAEVQSIKTEVRIAVETAILREAVRVSLSRLATLDPARQTDYRSALGAIGEGE